jgi:hypothetical protein
MKIEGPITQLTPMKKVTYKQMGKKRKKSEENETKIIMKLRIYSIEPLFYQKSSTLL